MKLCAGIMLGLLSLLAGCAGTSVSPAPAVELTGTWWRPAEIAGKPVVIHAGAREPHILLRREDGRVTGFTGCNTVTGAYQLDGRTLRFGPLAMTRMACVGEAANALEASFTQALRDAVSYRITGQSLELRDAAGTVRARFDARKPD